METFSEMVPEEKHRVLICCMMALAEPPGTAGFPNPLYELGYEIDILEWDAVLNSKGESVAPDIILTDRKSNHSMVVECKSSELNENQIERYNNVERTDLVDWGIGSDDPRKLTHDTTLVSSYENSGTFFNTLHQWNCTFPALQVGLVQIEKIVNEFSREELNRIFPIRIRFEYIPQYLYPISRESPDHVVMEQILQGLLSRLYRHESEEFEVDLKDVVIDIFPHWESMGTDIRAKIMEKCQRIIVGASKDKGVGRYIEYQYMEHQSGRIKFRIPNYRRTNAVQAFQRVGTEYIGRLRKSYVQQRLF